MGYYDDGEEHLGVAEDDHDKKKRLQEVANETDSKGAKKARKLAEGTDGGPAQKNTMLNFLRTGPSATNSSSSLAAAKVAQESLLDIDSLLGGGDSKSKPSSKMAAATLAAAQKKTMGPGLLGRPMMPLHRPNLPPRPSLPPSSSSSLSYSQYGNDGDDYDYGGGDSYASYDNADNSTGVGASNNGSSNSSGMADNVKMEIDGASTIKVEASAVDPVKKISIGTTSRKLKISEPSKYGGGGDAGFDPFKPTLGFDTSVFSTGTSADNSELGASVTGSAASASSSMSSSNAIDPKAWIKHHTAAEGEDASENYDYVTMYWFDACETNGVIYLFGKVLVDDGSGNSKKYVSCCVTVLGCQRVLYVLPKATSEYNQDGTPLRKPLSEVHAEMTSILVPSVIPKTAGAGFKAKKETMKYAFEHQEVPREPTDYLKIAYSAKFGVPSSNLLSGGKSYDRIFGSTNSPLENFILERDLSGPGWVTIKYPRTTNSSVSWSKLEIGVDDPSHIVKIQHSSDNPPPPLVTLCVSIKTAVNPTTHVHEIIAMAGSIHTNVDQEGDTDLNPAHMQRFVYVRPLGLSCGPGFPSQFPHDLASEVKRVGNGVVKTFVNERSMLEYFFVSLQNHDPDLLASHNLFGFEFEVLLNRAQHNKIASWSRLGRLRRSKLSKSGVNDRDIACGRLLCDTYKAAKEFLRETTYSLAHLARSQLHSDKVEIDPIDVPKFFSNSKDILSIALHTLNDALLVQRLMMKLQIVPLTKRLTNISGNLWARTMRGARAERIEFLLLHRFHALNYILPERKAFNETKRGGMAQEDGEDDEENIVKVGGVSRKRAKAAYTGGLVLEPKKGLYDTFILLLDFNSLYPSIIQEYNLCFTTVDWSRYVTDSSNSTSSAVVSSSSSASSSSSSSSNKGKNKASVADDEDDDAGSDAEVEDVPTTGPSLPPLPERGLEEGILPKVIKELVQQRKVVKNLLKKERDPNKRAEYDIRQKALKLTANSMYGCLGFTFSRFYARPIAAMVTKMGREALQTTVHHAERNLALDVIYGDTDSVMINTNSTDLPKVRELGAVVCREVNKMYKSLELDIDGIFKSMLLLKKKKYAAVVIEEEHDGTIALKKEMKGLDLVRRDWCPLSKDTGKFVVDQILSGQPREEIVASIHEHLADLATRVRNGTEDLNRFVITKGLNKSPKDYPDCKGQAHLQVALEMLKNNRPVNIGDHIPFIICAQGPEGSHAPQRAKHPDDVIRSNGELSIDVEWYLANQILPPISRLCEPIEGTSAAILSTQLGLDAKKYARGSSAADDDGDDCFFAARSQQADVDRFKDCLKLMLKCSSCNQETPFSGLVGEGKEIAKGSQSFTCTCCGALYLGRKRASDCYTYMSNRITLLVRECVNHYYDYWLVCDDDGCPRNTSESLGRRTQQQSIMGHRCTADGCHGRVYQEYDDSALHTQLKYLETLFNLEKFERDLKRSEHTSSHAISRDDKEVFKLLHQHMSNAINGSAYNWIRPSLWTAILRKPVSL